MKEAIDLFMAYHKRYRALSHNVYVCYTGVTQVAKYVPNNREVVVVSIITAP